MSLADHPTSPGDETAATITITPERRAYLNTVMETRRPLREEVQQLIATHREGTPPPFTSPEMIIMAIITSKKEYCSRREIADWVRATFPYYDELVIDAVEETKDITAWFNLEYDAMNYMDGDFLTAFIAHDLPLEEDWEGYNVNVDAARIFLRRWLEPPREGNFRFLDLPAELRNRIYDMVLVFPRSTLQVKNERYVRTSAVYLEAYERDAPDWQGAGEHPILSPNDILNIARVSKQLAKETIPVFFGSNKFVFDGPTTITNFLKIVPAHRMRLLKRLHIKLPVYSSVWKSWDDKMLLAVLAINADTTLDELTIRLEDRISWYPVNRRNLDYEEWEQLKDFPSMLALARVAVKAKEYKIFYERCLGAERLKRLKDEMDGEINRLKRLVGEVS